MYVRNNSKSHNRFLVAIVSQRLVTWIISMLLRNAGSEADVMECLAYFYYKRKKVLLFAFHSW